MSYVVVFIVCGDGGLTPTYTATTVRELGRQARKSVSHMYTYIWVISGHITEIHK